MIDRYVWIFGVALVAASVFFWSLIPHRRRLMRFRQREELALDTIFTDFFGASGFPRPLVLELWNEVASLLRVPPGKLRPSDRFDKELAPVEGWEFDDEIGDLNWAAEKRLKELGKSADLPEIQTIRDYIEFFCRLAEDK